ncbi:MAG: Fe-S cluster assembly protein IscX [Anaerolineae bacterium]|nr:Fe-S cluster assembly protein IscX [Anaerolineae bacterium]
MTNADDPVTLDWDASYEIVLALMRTYPDLDVNSVGLTQLKQMIIALPNFVDDPTIAHDGLLREILREWFEELTQ